MAKLPRKLQKILGGNSSFNGQFGSARAGTFVLDNDLDVIQSLPAWESGWNQATVSGDKLPTIEETQGVDYVLTSQIAYILQEGIPEYNEETVYYENSIVKEAGTVKIYRSLSDDNEGNPLDGGSDPQWELLVDLETVQPLSNYEAAADPTVGDDDTDGYGLGSLWYNTISGDIFTCVDPSTGAAVWVSAGAIPDGSITNAKLADMDTQTIKGRNTAGTGAPEDLTGEQVRTIIGLDSLFSGMQTTVLRGAVPSNAADAANDLTFTAGSFVSQNGVVFSVPIMTKQADAAWAAGTNAGGGSMSDGTFHCFAISKADGTDGDWFFSTSLTPTLPTDYTEYVRVYSTVRASSTNKLISAMETAGGGLYISFLAPVKDVEVSNLGTTAVAYALASVPSGLEFVVEMNATIAASGAPQIRIFEVDQPNDAANTTSESTFNLRMPTSSNSVGAQFMIKTNTSAEIKAISSAASTSLTVSPTAYRDERR
jgi:hypothetical protein